LGALWSFSEKKIVEILQYFDKKLPILTIVRGLRVQKINSTVAFYWRGYGISQKLKPQEQSYINNGQNVLFRKSKNWKMNILIF